MTHLPPHPITPKTHRGNPLRRCLRDDPAAIELKPVDSLSGNTDGARHKTIIPTNGSDEGIG